MVGLLDAHAGPDAGDDLHHVRLAVRTPGAVDDLAGACSAGLAQPAGRLVRQLRSRHRLVSVLQVTENEEVTSDQLRLQVSHKL